MQDNQKISQIKDMLEVLSLTNHAYADEKIGTHYDYDGVLVKLQKAEQLMRDSARNPRPDNMPEDMAWSEKFVDPNEEPDPYVFDGSMSPEDYDKMVTAREADLREGDTKVKDVAAPVKPTAAPDGSDYLLKIKYFTPKGPYAEESEPFYLDSLQKRTEYATEKVNHFSNLAGWEVFAYDPDKNIWMPYFPQAHGESLHYDTGRRSRKTEAKIIEEFKRVIGYGAYAKRYVAGEYGDSENIPIYALKEFGERGRHICDLSSDASTLLYKSNPEIHDDVFELEDRQKYVEEYVRAYEGAQPLVYPGVQNYRKLCEFNGYMLAASKQPDGYQFVTWKVQPDGVTLGNYYGNYREAKENFADRAELVDASRYFSEDTLHSVLTNFYGSMRNFEAINSNKDGETISEFRKKLEYLFPEFDPYTEMRPEAPVTESKQPVATPRSAECMMP